MLSEGCSSGCPMYPGMHIAGARQKEVEREPFPGIDPQNLLRLPEGWEQIQKHPTRVQVLLGCAVSRMRLPTCVNAEDYREYMLNRRTAILERGCEPLPIERNVEREQPTRQILAPYCESKQG
ncbi:hypothetical protein B0H12DRAFT_1104130 [Mycena haematopus]|nr:hypothetical protein B0H12DRAFT_1104130 [Mycena haematopus]